MSFLSPIPPPSDDVTFGKMAFRENVRGLGKISLGPGTWKNELFRFEATGLGNPKLTLSPLPYRLLDVEKLPDLLSI